jgi:ABC-type transporter Mla subunit MlaD
MQEIHEPPPDVGGPARSRRRPPRKRGATPDGWTPQDLEAILAAHHEAIAAQIEQGVRKLEAATADLGTELAPEETVSSEDTARGLIGHVDERYQGLSLRIERLEGALRRLVQTLKQMNSGATGRQEDMARRIEGLSSLIREASARQQHHLADFTERTGQGLAQVAARAGEGLARVARQHENHLDEKLEQMLEAVESLAPAAAEPPRWQPRGNGGPDKAASAFMDRLRAAEGRLARVSGDLAGWDPFADPSDAPAVQPEGEEEAVQVAEERAP